MRYGKVFTAFWTSPDIADLSPEAKLIGAYLLTSGHGNMLGCYRLPRAYVVDDLRMGSETVSEGFRNLCERGFITYDSALSWVLINKFLKWNPIENPNQGKAATRLVLEVPKNSSVYAPLIEILTANPTHFLEGFLNGLANPSETVSEPVTVTVAVTGTEILSPSARTEPQDDSPKAKRGTRISDNFAVTEQHRQFARENGLPSPDAEVGKFIDHWLAKPGKDGRKSDWNATFRNWLRNALEFAPRSTKGGCSSTTSEHQPPTRYTDPAALYAGAEYAPTRRPA